MSASAPSAPTEPSSGVAPVVGDPSRAVDGLWQDSLTRYPPTRGPLYDHRQAKERFNREREAARSRPIDIIVWRAVRRSDVGPFN